MPPIDSTTSHGVTTPRWNGPGNVALVLMALLVVVAGAFAVVAVRHRDESSAEIRPSGIPADVSTSLADLMALSPVPNHAAPGFTLTDQNGHTMALSSFRGRAVVIEFMDPHCTDICPIVSQEFVDAYHDLGATASKVAFLAVNVNQYFATVADVDSFTHEHYLNAIPSWHFFTGPVPLLEAAWQDYGVQVEAPNPKADIIHTSVVFFIDPNGHERYIATPMDDHTKAGTAYLPANQLASWGQGIALIARGLVG